MTSLKFDKTKYIRILESSNVDAALTALHLDIAKWEVEAFEGRKGYNPELWKEIDSVRTFSRDLWEISLQRGHS